MIEFAHNFMHSEATFVMTLIVVGGLALCGAIALHGLKTYK